MKLETRVNLIFLAVFLAISLPGAVILFKRKLDPAAAPMYLPDPVRQRLPYMAPQWTPDEVTRVIPPLTGKWVDELNGNNGGAEVLLRDRLPLLSEDRMVQVTAMKYTPPALTVYAITWGEEYGADASHYDVSVATASGTTRGSVASARQISMPDSVRKELLNAGYVKPPTSVVWLELKFDAAPPAQPPFLLNVSYQKDGEKTATSVNLFTR